MNKKVSIIVPVYNVEEYIDKCIDSLLQQTYKNIEIILVDDGSTDLSGEKCDNYKSQDERILVFHKSNGGLADARNYGINKSSGDFLIFVDSDDWIESNTVENAISVMNDDQSDMVVYGITIDYENGKKKVKAPLKKECIDKKRALIYINSFKGIDVSACNKMFKRKLFNNISFPYGKLCEDYYIMYKIFDCCSKISIIPSPYYHYFQRTNSISRNSNVNMDYLYAAEEEVEYFKNHHEDILFSAITGYVFANIVIYSMKYSRNITFDKRKIQKEMRKYKKYIFQNKTLSILRKLQFLLFSYMGVCYDFYLKIK